MPKYTCVLLFTAVLLLQSCLPNQQQDDLSQDDLPLLETPTSTKISDSIAQTNQPIVITYGDLDVNRPAYEALIHKFNEENPDVRVQFVAINSIKDDLPRLADTFRASEGPSNTGYLNLKPLVDADSGLNREDFYPGALQSTDSSNSLYIMPHRLTCFNLLGYNQQLWQEAGVEPPFPDWTWDDVLNTSARLAKKNGDEIETYGLLLTSSQVGSLFVELLKQSGIDLFSPETQLPAFDSTEVTGVFDRLTGFVDSGVLAPPSLSDGGKLSSSLLQAQRVGMWSTDLTGVIGFNALNYPVSMARIASDFPCTTIGYAASAGTQHQQATYRWLAFLSRQPFGETDGATIGDIAARKSVAEAIGYWKSLDAQSAAVINSVLADYARTRGSPDYYRPAGYEATRYARALDRAVEGLGQPGKTPQELLRQAQQQFDQDLAKGPPPATPTPDPAPIVVATPMPQVVADTADATAFSVPSSLSEAARRVADEFNKANPTTPIAIDTISPGRSPFEETAKFDCFTWLRPPSPSETSQLLDLQPLIDADASFPRDDYLPGLFAPFQRSNKLYGVPLAFSPRVIAYNPVLFDRAGVALPQTNWDVEQFLATAEQLTNRDVSPPHYGFVGNQLEDLQTFVGGAGAQLVERKNNQIEPNFTDAATQQAINQFVALTRDASPYKGMVGYNKLGKPNEIEPETLIANNQVAMWYAYAAPNVASAEQSLAFAPLPSRNLPDLDSMLISGMSIRKGAKAPEACWQFMRQLAEQPVDRFGFAARRSLAEKSITGDGVPAGAAEVYRAYVTILASETDLPNLRATDEEQMIEYFWVMRAVDRILDGSATDQLLAEAQAYTSNYLQCARDKNEFGLCAIETDRTYRGFR